MRDERQADAGSSHVGSPARLDSSRISGLREPDFVERTADAELTRGLTPGARAAIRAIVEAGIAFTITSGRPPLGMKPLIDDLQLQDPIAAFNGGLLVRPDLSVIREHLIPSEPLKSVIDILTKDTLDVWVYGGKDWYVKSRHGPHVDREEWTVKFPPTVVLHLRACWIESSRSSV